MKKYGLIISLIFLFTFVCFTVVAVKDFAYNTLPAPTENDSLETVNDTLYCGGVLCSDYYLKSNPFSFYNSTSFPSGDFWQTSVSQSGLTGNKSGSFDLTTTGTGTLKHLFAEDVTYNDGLGGTAKIDLVNEVIFDGGTTAIDWNNRYLSDDFGFDALRWEDKQLKSGPGVSIDWANRILYDSFATPSYDWENRVLYYDTATPALNFSVAGTLNGGASGFTTTGAGNFSNLLVSKDSISGTLTTLPTIKVSNTHTSTGINDFSFASFVMYGNNSAVKGEFFADGSGFFNGGTGDIYFRVGSNHPMLFGTNSVERMRIEAGGNMLLASTNRFQFRDTATYVYSSGANVLDIVAPTINLGGNAKITGNLNMTGISSLITLNAITLPICNSGTNGSIARNITSNKPAYCDGATWNALY